ncbi:3-deoxy-manno-octulosonate cytidylyltransferase [Sphingomonas sp. NBWT7]|uniref:3-deoxy-manno-octulosonate cytidylyltransferase n=1 Tax=Sphingomonas sp. NBWT7 TaxID=2596913 RepID=UPI00162561FC|nr:3-deoxy-manno-octulosonate cytidylyltransferase [Sphingomonas sp. NBWT7]QNE31312.1 3-deoxy-manno-octulosonate cytidylyltransferase [Sphingomonas sp. NBWT7]
MSVLVVIPARAGSTRLPMKPLRAIAGVTLLHRTIALARRGMIGDAASLVVATDDARIADHAAVVGCAAVMTDCAISSGSGRALAAALTAPTPPSIVINMQGDAPFQPATALPAVIAALSDSAIAVATPVVRLTWSALDSLRAHKLIEPFSGTTCVRAPNGRAHWFSKTILPVIRNEATLRASGAPCPIWRHVGLYGYRMSALQDFEAAPPSSLERLEGLEQLRFFDLDIAIDTVEVTPAPFDISGIDTEADIARAEAMIALHGDPHQP